MRVYSLFILLLVASACFTKQERKEEVAFNGVTFGMEAFTKQTLETTLRHTEIYLEGPGKDRKYFQTRETSSFSYFPLDTAIVNKMNPVVIDTTIRYPEQYPPQQTTSTLYLNPSHYTKEEYDLIVAFLKQEYGKPDPENKVLRWLNYEGPETPDTAFWNSVYAVAYVDLAAWQTTFRGEDNDHWATLLVNNTVDFAGDIETLQMRTNFFIRRDTLIYHEAEEESFQLLKTYKDPSGKTILDYCTGIKTVQDMSRFYTPPFQ